MNASNKSSDQQLDALDAFLTNVEMKLKGPFSSLELPRSVQARQLRLQQQQQDKPDTNSTYEAAAAVFVSQLQKIFEKMDMTTRLRSLVALLGFDSDAQLNAAFENLLQHAQEVTSSPDVWVRVLAGLVQGILFRKVSELNPSNEQDEEETNSSQEERLIGAEARQVLETTCQTILDQVWELANTQEQDSSNKQQTMEADPTFAPYWYALLSPELLQQALPETSPQQTQAHFTIEESADILKVDDQLLLEAAANTKAGADETNGTSGTSSNNRNTQAAARRTATPHFPGFRSKSSVQQQRRTQPPKKSSMFLPARKPMATAATKTTLHTRKKGAAQALVGKGRVIRPQSSQAQSSQQQTGARAGKLGGTTRRAAGKSRMKLLDVAQVQELTAASNKTATAGTATATSNKHKPLRKRKLGTTKPTAQDESARKKPAVGLKPSLSTTTPGAQSTSHPDTCTNTATDTADETTTTDAANALASAALSAYQAQLMAATPAAPAPAGASAAAPAPHAHKQQDWRQLLQEKSNKLSQDDRFRIQQFFVDRFNPTPNQPTYKMKLHEERMTDPNTQQPVKETYYLELDYTNFTSRQSKKVKRY